MDAQADVAPIFVDGPLAGAMRLVTDEGLRAGLVVAVPRNQPWEPSALAAPAMSQVRYRFAVLKMLGHLVWIGYAYADPAQIGGDWELLWQVIASDRAKRAAVSGEELARDAMRSTAE